MVCHAPATLNTACSKLNGSLRSIDYHRLEDVRFEKQQRLDIFSISTSSATILAVRGEGMMMSLLQSNCSPFPKVFEEFHFTKIDATNKTSPRIVTIILRCKDYFIIFWVLGANHCTCNDYKYE
ncbi:uncharacterized protein [Triticum aestivum]|nr:uncharacterized protein LOC123160614 isoform X2 [Triticum aestivum]